MVKLKDYQQCINILGLDKKSILNNNIRYDKIPEWAKNEDFEKLFLPYIELVADSREQNDYYTSFANAYGIKTSQARKDKKTGNENLKEGDYTFKVHFGETIFDFTGSVSYEKKGSASEFYNNCLNDRERLENEFERQLEKGYKKFVIVLEFGNSLKELINYKFYYEKRNQYGYKQRYEKDCKKIIYSTLQSWIQPSRFNCHIIQKNIRNEDFELQRQDRVELFWTILHDMFYYFRNIIKKSGTEKFNSEQKNG